MYSDQRAFHKLAGSITIGTGIITAIPLHERRQLLGHIRQSYAAKILPS
jgi:hypothetical protein